MLGELVTGLGLVWLVIARRHRRCSDACELLRGAVEQSEGIESYKTQAGCELPSSTSEMLPHVQQSCLKQCFAACAPVATSARGGYACEDASVLLRSLEPQVRGTIIREPSAGRYFWKVEAFDLVFYGGGRRALRYL